MLYLCSIQIAIIFINKVPTVIVRADLVKQVKHEGENAKISIRNTRHDAMHNVKALKDEGISEDDIKHGEDLIQKLTDEHSTKVDELINHKEEEIMKV